MASFWEECRGSTCSVGPQGTPPDYYQESSEYSEGNPYKSLTEKRLPWYMDPKYGVSTGTKRALYQAEPWGWKGRLGEMQARLERLELGIRELPNRPEMAFRRWMMQVGISQEKQRIAKYKQSVESCSDTYRRVMAKAQKQAGAAPATGGAGLSQRPAMT